jgi:hypothetical protein
MKGRKKVSFWATKRIAKPVKITFDTIAKKSDKNV